MGVVTVTEEFLRMLIDHAGSNHARENLHGQLDVLDGAVGRDELQKAEAARLAAEQAANAPPAAPDPRDAEIAALRAQLAAQSEPAKEAEAPA
jgi:hypothetical protein